MCDDSVGWLAGDPFGRGAPGSVQARTSACARGLDALLSEEKESTDQRPGPNIARPPAMADDNRDTS